MPVQDTYPDVDPQDGDFIDGRDASTNNKTVEFPAVSLRRYTKFRRTVNTATAVTVNAALDMTIQLLQGATAVTVTLAQAAGTNTQVMLVKETDQTVTVVMAGSATYRLPGDDDSVTQTASFQLTGSAMLIGDGSNWMVIGATDHEAVWQSNVDAHGFEIRNYRDKKYNNLTGAQTLSTSTFNHGATLIHSGAAAVYTLPTRVGISTVRAVHLVIHNRGSGAITLTPSGITLKGSTSIAANGSATLEWESDGTTEYVWARAV